MQPAARLSAAIEILDLYLSGVPAEKALTNWARRSRFAGSKDRAAVRDIVFDSLRKRKSYAALGGSETGRGLIYGYVQQGRTLQEVEALFSGEGHAPSSLSDVEKTAFGKIIDESWDALYDMPNWLKPELERSLGSKTLSVCKAMTQRAPVFLRVNARKTSLKGAQAELAQDGILTNPHPLAKMALEVTENPRKVAISKAYLEGRVELQDVASQAVCEGLPKATRMLDYCAGGGGKVLAYGASHDTRLFAHDANPVRLRDLGTRAKRAGLEITVLDRDACINNAPYDLVLCDVPCSGSGSWRRAPDGKWSLNASLLAEIQKTQRHILDEVASLVSKGGHLVYVTCSVLMCENFDQVQDFTIRNSQFELAREAQFLPADGGDGFYLAHLTCI